MNFSFFLTHSMSRGDALFEDARAICDKINKALGDAGCTTEDDCRAEIERLDPELVSLCRIEIASIEVTE